MSHGLDSARRRARELAFRIAYQADLTGDPYREVWSALREDETLSDDQAELVGDVVGVLEARASEVDAALQQAAEHWPIVRLAATDRSVLRSAIAELMVRGGTPARVVLDEAIEIAKRYGSEESGRFVNGVLDRVARQLRPGEL
jgi:N utilization substance protein B